MESAAACWRCCAKYVLSAQEKRSLRGSDLPQVLRDRPKMLLPRTQDTSDSQRIRTFRLGVEVRRRGQHQLHTTRGEVRQDLPAVSQYDLAGDRRKGYARLAQMAGRRAARPSDAAETFLDYFRRRPQTDSAGIIHLHFSDGKTWIILGHQSDAP